MQTEINTSKQAALRNVNLIKIRCLLYIKKKEDSTLTSNYKPSGVISGSIFSTDQSPMSLIFETEYIPRDVVRLVNINIFNCLAYDWTVKDKR